MLKTTRQSPKRVAVLVCAAMALFLAVAFSPAVFAQDSSTCAWTHLIRPGDTLSAIARYYGTTVQDLAELNGIANVSLIYWGRSLCISNTVPPPAPYGNTYTIRPGDTLGYLAWRLGITVGELALHNGIGNINLIFAGEIITVPHPLPTVPYVPPPPGTATVEPTEEPTEEPTVVPTVEPTEEPTVIIPPPEVTEESTDEVAG